MNAVDRTCVDSLLDAFSGIAVLSDRSGASQMRLHNECVGSNVCAIAAAYTNGLINPDSLISHIASQQGFPSGGLLLRAGGGGKGVRRRISQVSSVPAGHHEFNRTILLVGLFGYLKTLFGGGCQNCV